MSLHRAAPADLQVRSDGRTIMGIAMPWDAKARVNDGYGPYTEVFRRGAFRKTITERGKRVKALANHDRRQLPLGRADTLREDASGLYVEMRVSKTRAGDEALELVRDGALDSFSVGFAPVKERTMPDGTVERTEVRLDEVSVVAFPAYDGALIAGVRDASVPDLRRMVDDLGSLDERDRLLARRAYLYDYLQELLEAPSPTEEDVDQMRQVADDLAAVVTRLESFELSSVQEEEVTEAADGEPAERTCVQPDEPTDVTRRSLTEAAIKAQVADLNAYLKRKDAA